MHKPIWEKYLALVFGSSACCWLGVTPSGVNHDMCRMSKSNELQLLRMIRLLVLTIGLELAAH